MANYKDPRLTQVEEDKKEALSNLEQTYGGMIENSNQYYQDQIDASKQWAEQQGKIQQEQTDFAIQQIEQQKAQAQQNYMKEQSGAYVDWKKQSNQYGAEAEKMAASGLENTGYSESSQVNMYNTYQNRVAAARQAIEQAVTNYNNSIASARLQNNAALAEIAASALQQQLELSLQGFQYENSLILQREETRQAYENIYYQRYLDVLNQMNAEAALAEQRRQANISNTIRQQELEFKKEQYEYQKQQIQKENGANAQYMRVYAANNFSGTTYKSATDFLKANGLASYVGNIMNEREWMGHGKPAGSYAAYLKAAINQFALYG